MKKKKYCICYNCINSKRTDDPDNPLYCNIIGEIVFGKLAYSIVLTPKNCLGYTASKPLKEGEKK
jgi:hypothetical protein